MKQSSLEEYLLPDLSTRESQVLHSICVLGNIACMDMIRKETGLPANSITPRLAELEQKGLIVREPKELSPLTHKKVLMWRKC